MLQAWLGLRETGQVRAAQPLAVFANYETLTVLRNCVILKAFGVTY